MNIHWELLTTLCCWAFGVEVTLRDRFPSLSMENDTSGGIPEGCSR